MRVGPWSPQNESPTASRPWNPPAEPSATARTADRPDPAGAPWRLRLRVFCTRGALDGQIAAGHPCDSSERLALRGRQLQHPRSRRRVARNLRRLVERVDRLGTRPDLSAVVIHRRAIRAGRAELLGLAERLEMEVPVSPRGASAAQALLTDVASPIYNPGCQKTVAQAVWEVSDLLEAKAPPL